MKFLTSKLLMLLKLTSVAAERKCCKQIEVESPVRRYKETCEKNDSADSEYICNSSENLRVELGAKGRAFLKVKSLNFSWTLSPGETKENDNCWYDDYQTKAKWEWDSSFHDFQVKCITYHSTGAGGSGAGGSGAGGSGAGGSGAGGSGAGGSSAGASGAGGSGAGGAGAGGAGAGGAGAGGSGAGGSGAGGAGSAACLSGWGSDIANCYPEDAVLECSSTGFKLSGLTKSIMYESSNALKSGHKYGILANGESVGTFDDNGDVTIEKTWNDITDLTVTHSTDSIKFEVEISAEDPAVKVGDVTIHTTRTESFKITCSYSDKVKITLDDGPMDVNVGNELGTSGSIDESKDVWSSLFNLNVYSENTYTTKITSTEPISLGSPVYGKIVASDLPTALQYFVSNCEAKASAEETETTKISIFNNYECFNPIFGDSESIFIGRSIKTGSKTDYKFSFPAFTFNVVENDQLHITCEITICPADSDCIETSYSAQRGNDDDSCNSATAGFKSNTASG